MDKGIILKGVGSFYTVCSLNDKREYTLRLRGIFRKEKITPKVGDMVYFNAQEERIEKIVPRKNELVRPPLANIDNVFIVSALKNPKVNFLLLDKMIINSLINNIKVNLIFNKSDLSNKNQIEEIKEIYSMYPLFFTSVKEDLNVDTIYPHLKGKTNVFTGVSGVGKSSLLNKLYPNFNLETNSVSKKIQRGKHTTRHSELFYEGDNTFIADTPGFSSLSIKGIEKEELWEYFEEFEEFINCKFSVCSHTNEPGCKVIEAAKMGKIKKSRYESYLYLYNMLKEEEENKY